MILLLMVYYCCVSVSSGCVCRKYCCDCCDDASEKDGGCVTNNNDSYKKDPLHEKPTNLNQLFVDLNNISVNNTPLHMYDGSYKSNINMYAGQYQIFAVPILACYSGVSEVYNFCAFKLDKEYFSLFPKGMCDLVLDYIQKNNIQSENFHIFVEYQYNSMLSLQDFDYNDAPPDPRILLRPHFFFADKQGLGIETLMDNIGKVVLEVRAYCVLSDGNSVVTHDNIVFEVHDGGHISPLYGWFEDEKTMQQLAMEEKTSTLYSFVVDKKRKVAAVTIHLIKVIDNSSASWQFLNKILDIRGKDYSTLSEAINLASDLDDKVAKEFFENLVKKDNS